MICPNCGNENNESSSFCVKCGANLKEVKKEEVKEEVSNTENSTVVEKSTVNETPKNVDTPKKSSGTFNYIKFIIAFLTAPFKGFKDNEDYLSDTKNSLIISGGMAVIMMLINLITSMINAIFAKTFDYSTFSYKTKVDFGRLGDLDYGSLIFKNLLIYAGIIAVIAVVYFLFAMLFKKKANYIKLLSSTAISLLPTVLGSMFIAPILGKIWSPLAVVVSVASITYTIAILITLINDQVKLEDKNCTIYYHALSITVLLTAGYYILINVLLSGITKGASNILNMLN